MPDCVPRVVWVNFLVDLCVSRIWLQEQAAFCREQQTFVSVLRLAEAAHGAGVAVGPRALSRRNPKTPELT